jgi:hypothetical protein
MRLRLIRFYQFVFIGLPRRTLGEGWVSFCLKSHPLHPRNLRLLRFNALTLQRLFNAAKPTFRVTSRQIFSSTSVKTKLTREIQTEGASHENTKHANPAGSHHRRF